MRWWPWAISGFVLAANLLVSGPVWAADEVAPGQPAPYEGALIEAAKVPRLVEELRSARLAVAEIQALQETVVAQSAQVAALLEQAKALEGANERLTAALKIAEEIEGLRQKQKDVAALVFERYEKALTQADAALDKAQARIESLERRAMWSQILSVIGPLALLLLMVF